MLEVNLLVRPESEELLKSSNYYYRKTMQKTQYPETVQITHNLVTMQKTRNPKTVQITHYLMTMQKTHFHDHN